MDGDRDLLPGTDRVGGDRRGDLPGGHTINTRTAYNKFHSSDHRYNINRDHIHGGIGSSHGGNRDHHTTSNVNETTEVGGRDSNFRGGHGSGHGSGHHSQNNPLNNRGDRGSLANRLEHRDGNTRGGSTRDGERDPRDGTRDRTQLPPWRVTEANNTQQANTQANNTQQANNTPADDIRFIN